MKKYPYVLSPSLKRSAKKDAITHQIITSPKWRFITEQKNNSCNFLSFIRKLINKVEDTYKVVQNNSILKENISISTKLGRISSYDFHSIHITPEDIEENFNPLIVADNFFSDALLYVTQNTTIDNKLFDDHTGYQKALERHKQKIINEHKDNAFATQFNQTVEMLKFILSKMKKNSSDLHYFLDIDWRICSNYRDWEKGLHNYYKKEIQKKPQIMDLPKDFNHEPKSPIVRHNPLPIAKTPTTISAPTKPQTHKTPLPETTQQLLKEAEEKRERTTYIYPLLTPEEQHTIDSIFDTHIPEIINTLQSLISIQSDKTAEATTQCNHTITKATTKINTIITATETNLINKLTADTKSIEHILK